MKESVFRIYMPYNIQKEDRGYMILNRDYAPVGTFRVRRDIENVLRVGQGCRNTEFSVVKIIGLTQAKANKIDYRGSEASLDCIYLYNDGCNPIHSKADMDRYLQRLAVFNTLSFLPIHPDDGSPKDDRLISE